MIGFPKKWHHGHSAGLGAVAALAVYSYAPYLLFAAGAAIGAAVVCLTVGVYRLGRTLLAGFEAWRDDSRARRAPVPAEPVPHYSTRSSSQGSEIPY